MTKYTTSASIIYLSDPKFKPIKSEVSGVRLSDKIRWRDKFQPKTTFLSALLRVIIYFFELWFFPISKGTFECVDKSPSRSEFQVEN